MKKLQQHKQQVMSNKQSNTRNTHAYTDDSVCSILQCLVTLHYSIVRAGFASTLLCQLFLLIQALFYATEEYLNHKFYSSSLNCICILWNTDLFHVKILPDNMPLPLHHINQHNKLGEEFFTMLYGYKPKKCNLACIMHMEFLSILYFRH